VELSVIQPHLDHISGRGLAETLKRNFTRWRLVAACSLDSIARILDVATGQLIADSDPCIYIQGWTLIPVLLGSFYTHYNGY